MASPIGVIYPPVRVWNAIRENTSPSQGPGGRVLAGAGIQGRAGYGLAGGGGGETFLRGREKKGLRVATTAS